MNKSMAEIRNYTKGENEKKEVFVYQNIIYLYKRKIMNKMFNFMLKERTKYLQKNVWLTVTYMAAYLHFYNDYRVRPTCWRLLVIDLYAYTSVKVFL